MSQLSRHSNLQKRASSRTSMASSARREAQAQKGGDTSQRGVALQVDDVDHKSYHSMTFSQRQSRGQKLQDEMGILPGIEQHKQVHGGMRPQSASKQSATSFAGSHKYSDKKGPIKAFGPMDTPDKGAAASDDRFDKVQVVSDKLSERPNKLNPINQGQLLSSHRKSRGSTGIRSKSSQKMLQSQRGHSKGEMRVNSDVEEAKEHVGVIPPPTPPPKRNVQMTEPDQPVSINLDLHQVGGAKDNSDKMNQSRSGVSMHDQEATPVKFSNKKETHDGSRLGDKSPSALGAASNQQSSRSNMKSKKSQKQKRANQFKANKMSHEEIINFLFELSSSSVAMNRKLEPRDLDSTQGLDSFLQAIVHVNEHNIQKKDQKLVDNLHLSTGTRTNFCFEVLNFVIKHQAKETIFIDAVEFFQESLEHLVKVENENKSYKQQVEELTTARTELTMMRFDLQNKLRETSNALLKLRQKQYEQTLQYNETKQHLQAKQAECESLHYRLKHLGFGVTDDGQQTAAAGSSIQPQTIQTTVEDNVRMNQDGGMVRIESSIAEGGLAEQRSSQELQPASAADPEGTISSVDQSSVKPREPVDLDKAAEDIQKGLETQVAAFMAHKRGEPLVSEDEEQTNTARNLQGLRDLLNQVQIDNKNLQDENSSLKTRLEGKDRRVVHLENKVTTILVENEEHSLKLKSEIVLLKNQIDQNSAITSKQIQQMREKVESENERENGQTISELQDFKDRLTNENTLQKNRIEQLNADYKKLHSEFSRFREEKKDLDGTRDKSMSELEHKLSTLSKIHVNSKNTSSERIKSLENSLEQKVKENQILFLRLRYMRQITDVLLRQKNFLTDTLHKSKQELEMKMNQLESGMLSQNKNKSYLVSVEKAIKQSRNVAEISKSALQNILQIVKFFKVEKIHQLVFEAEEPADNQDMKSDHSGRTKSGQQRTVNKPLSDARSETENGEAELEYHLEKIQAMLNDLKSCLDLPVNFKPRIPDNIQVQPRSQSRAHNQSKVVKNEEYYLEHAPIELVSALVKVVVESLIRTNTISSVEQIPFSISRLLYLASNRSDQTVERELFENYCFESNKILVDEINHFQDKVEIFEKVQNLVPGLVEDSHQDSTERRAIKVTDVELQSVAHSSSPAKVEPLSAATHKSGGRKQLTMMQQSALMMKMQQKSDKSQSRHIQIKEQASETRSPNSATNKGPSSDIASNDFDFQGMSLSKKQMRTELKLMQVQVEEQKVQNRQIQQGLAEKIIKLEETIDYIKEDHEDKLAQAEFSYRQELEQIRLGTMQREKQLLSQIEMLQERNASLEISSEQQQQNQSLTKQMQSSSNHRHSRSSMSVSRLRGENLRQAASVHSLVQQMDNEAQEKLQAMESKFETFQQNVKEFVRIRESTYGTISIVFEAANTNESMINESMLSFYLSRIFRLPKEKFRFLKTEYFVAEKRMHDNQKANEQSKSLRKKEMPVDLIKVVVEVIQEHQLFKHDMFELKLAIRDGSSLLYDLLPSYISINMGYSGLATSMNLQNCQLISKRGRQINGVDFVVNLLRSTINPYSFTVILLKLQTGEEYCLELQEQDILQMTEGDRGLLEDSEPIDLQDMIVDNLEIIERDGVNFLTCTQKVYFNQLWHGVMASKLSQTSKHQPPAKQVQDQETRWRPDVEETQINPSYTKTSIRDNMLLKSTPLNRMDQHHHYKSLLIKEAGCQTDFEGSILYDSMVTVFKGQNQLNQEVKIDLDVQQSQHENLVSMSFREARTGNVAKFCVFNRTPNAPMSMTNQSEAITLGEDSANSPKQANGDFESRVSSNGNQGQPKSQYIIHSEVINAGKDHLIMVCVERIQNDGFLVKLHDLKLITSEEFYLVRKSNGHLMRFNLSQNLQLMYQEDFRNLIFDLAFAQQTQSQDLLLQNLTFASEKLQSIGKNPNLVSQELFKPQTSKTEDKTETRRIGDFKAEAFARTSNKRMIMDQNLEWKSLQDKGVLLYRNVKQVRTNFEKVGQTSARKSSLGGPPRNDEEIQESLISLYLKDDQVNIEVFLYQDEQKMSINTNVGSIELFGREPLEITFAERATLLDSMLEKLFVLQQDGMFHMKVENQSEPISVVIEKNRGRQLELNEFNNKSSSALKRRQFADQQFEEKVREIQMEKTSYVKSGKARLFQRYVSQNGIQYSVNIYIMLKAKKVVNKQSNKRLNTVNRTQQQIKQQKIEIYIEENGEFDQIYIETQPANADDILYILLDRRSLAKVLTRDVTCDWKNLISLYSHDFVDYVFNNIIIDLENKKIDIYNAVDITELLVGHCRAVNGGQLVKKEDNMIVDGFGDESTKLMRKELIFNEEVDFTEISYDIKLYKISRNSPFGSGNLQIGCETLSYHIEIFNVNQPDVIYKHRIPVQQTSTSNVHDPTSFIVDVFNLIDNPLVEELSEPKEDNLASERSNISRESRRATTKATPRKDTQNSKGSLNSKEQKKKEEEAAEREAERAREKAQLQDDRIKMENVMKEHSTKYQLLFNKYIDNQLVLVVQEQKFPATISFTLVEPSSRLIWKTCYEPSTEIVSPCSFSVVDQGSYETFMTVVYDTVMPQSVLSELKQQRVTARGEWHHLHEAESNFVQAQITDQLHIQIEKVKEVGKLRIRLKNPQVNFEEDSAPAYQDYTGSIDNLSKAVEPKFTGLDLVIQRNRGVYLNAKIINLDDQDLNKSIYNSYVLLVKVSVDDFVVQVINYHTFDCLFNFKFKHTNSVKEDVHMTPITQVNPFLKLPDIATHVIDALKNLNTEHLQEQIESNHIRIRQNRTLARAGLDEEEQDSRITTFETVLFKVHECAAHQQRFYQRKHNQVKTVTLHRKIYYDETMEKLIIITANIRYLQGMQRLDNPMLLNEEINEVDFKILEPEHNTLTTLTVPLAHCFNERQLSSLNKRDMLRLKHLIRIVLEERSDIRRKEMEHDEQHQAYTLFISPQPDDQYIEEMTIQEDEANSQDHMQHNLGMDDSQNMYMQDQQISHEGRQRTSSDPDIVPMDELISMDEMGQQSPDQRVSADGESMNPGTRNAGSNQRKAPSNSVIMEDVSQEDRDHEMESDGTPLIPGLRNKSSASNADGGMKQSLGNHQSQQNIQSSEFNTSSQDKLAQPSQSAQQL